MIISMIQSGIALHPTDYNNHSLDRHIYMNEIQDNILLQAQKMFYQYGIRNVSMDDIARELSVSKKTIYCYFDDKYALITSIAEEFIALNKPILLNCNEQSSDAVEEVLVQVEKSFAQLTNINYTFFYELERSFPKAWQLLLSYRQNAVLPIIIANLKRGIDEGLFRNDLDIRFIADLRLHQIITALTPGAFSGRRRSVHALMKELAEFYLHGITTIKGKERIKQHIDPAKK